MNLILSSRPEKSRERDFGEPGPSTPRPTITREFDDPATHGKGKRRGRAKKTGRPGA